MRKLIFALALTAGLTVLADGLESTVLWPEGKMPHVAANQTVVPTVEWYPAPSAETKCGACCLLVTGGAYMGWADLGWNDRIAERLTKMGIQCARLLYRIPRPEGMPIYRTAWADAQRAVRLLRSEAAKRGYDPENIGALGFSAGSHTVVLLGTSALTPAYAAVDALDDTPCHINWAIPIYTAYALTDGLEGENSTGGNGEGVKLDSLFAFDGKTCPMCMFHGSVDVYSPIASTRIYRRLRSMKIPAELHLYADRNHGFMGDENRAVTGYDTWFTRAEEFLRQMEFAGPLGREVPQDERYFADFTERIDKEQIWAEGRMPDRQANQQYEPYIEWYVPKTLKTKAIQIVAPGGGYGDVATVLEGVPVARYFNEKGMTCVLLKYRAPRPETEGMPKHQTAWEDAQRAIRVVRSRAAERGLDPDMIGFMGFSAGGHLTLMTATNTKTPAYASTDEIDDIPCTLQWALPVYPAYSLTDGGDVENTTGGNDDSAVLVPEFSFDDATPPMCFVHGDSDGWAAMNSVKAWEKLRSMGVQCDLHTLAKRYHCFQFNAAEGTGSYSWLDREREFLNHKFDLFEKK